MAYQIKVFSDYNTVKVEKAVNRWIGKQLLSDVKIHTSYSPGKGMSDTYAPERGLFTLTLLYREDPGPQT